MKIVIDPVKYRAWLHKKMVKRIKANEELLNLFKGDNMTGGLGGQAGATEAKLKDFEVVVKTLTDCKEIASSINERSRKLVSTLTGQSKPQKDEKEKKHIDSVVLVHVLRDIENDLGKSLNEISNNLEKLEEAW